MADYDDHDKQFYHLFNNLENGEIDGVGFEFRHPDLSVHEWEPYRPYDIRLLQRERRQPFIWYPWFGDFDLSEIVRISELLKQDQRLKYSETDAKLFIKFRTPEYQLKSGDQLRICKVEPIPIGLDDSESDFLHRHDSEVRLVYLEIVKPNNKRTQVRKPIAFCGKSSTTIAFWPFHGSDIFERLLMRLYQRLQVSNFDEFARKIQHMEFQEELTLSMSQAVRAAYSVELWTSEMRKRIAKRVHENPATDANPYSKIEEASDWGTILAGIEFGYYWGRVEMEEKVLPSAIVAKNVRAGGTIGGKRSGIIRRATAEKGWRAEAKKLAVTIRAERSDISQDNLATEIIFRWKDATQSCPGHRSIKALISEMERKGDLKPRRS